MVLRLTVGFWPAFELILDFGLLEKDCGMVLLGPEPGGKVQVLGEMLPEFL